MPTLHSLLQKTSSVKNICILFVASQLVLLLMMFFTFPVINSDIGTKAFDLQTFGYSVSTAKSIVNNLHERSLQLYFFPQLTLLDVCYPFLLALFLSSFLFRLIKITKAENRLTSIILLIPFLAMLFDYSENICIILMITKSIELSQLVVFLSSTFTILKGLLTSIAWLAILLYTARWFKMKIIEKKSSANSYKV